MITRPYDEFMGQAMALYRDGAYGDVLALLTEEGAQYPDEAATVLYLQSCMAARVGQPDLALDVLQDALDRGIWYGEQMMRESPSWQPLQGLPRFEQLATVAIARQREAQA